MHARTHTHHPVTGLLIYENKWVAGGRADDERAVNWWVGGWGGWRTGRLACGSASGSMASWQATERSRQWVDGRTDFQNKIKRTEFVNRSYFNY